MKKCFVISSALLILISCTSPEKQLAQLTQKKLEAQIQQTIASKEQSCNQLISELLDHQADSILVVLSKKIKYDSLTIPHDTLRPEKPDITFPDYQPPVKPD